MAQHLNADILSEGLILTGPDGTHLCDIDGLLKAKNEDKFFLVESKMTVQVITAVVTASVLVLTDLALTWLVLFAGVSPDDSQEQPGLVYRPQESAAEHSVEPPPLELLPRHRRRALPREDSQAGKGHRPPRGLP